MFLLFYRHIWCMCISIIAQHSPVSCWLAQLLFSFSVIFFVFLFCFQLLFQSTAEFTYYLRFLFLRPFHECSLISVGGPQFLLPYFYGLQCWCCFSLVWMTLAFFLSTMLSSTVFSEGWLVVLMLCIFFHCSCGFVAVSSHSLYCFCVVGLISVQIGVLAC